MSKSDKRTVFGLYRIVTESKIEKGFLFTKRTIYIFGIKFSDVETERYMGFAEKFKHFWSGAIAG